MHFGDYWQNQTIEKWPMIWLIIDSIWWTMNIKWRLATLQFAANTFICPLSLGEFVGGPVLMDPFTFSRLYWQKYHSFKALFLLRLRPEVMILPHRDLDHFVRDCFHIMLSQNGDFAASDWAKYCLPLHLRKIDSININTSRQKVSRPVPRALLETNVD